MKCKSVVYNAILIVVDYFSKMAFYILANKKWKAKDFANTFFIKIVAKHSIPKGIVLD